MISVCIATYNGGKYIEQQIASILSQLPKDGEIIISDDSSTDNTLKIIKAFNDERITIYPDQKFKNPILNFENAIKQASGDYIFLSDQDDEWIENKIDVMLDALKSYDLIVSNAFIGDESLNIIKGSCFQWRNSRAGFLKNLSRNSYLGCCMAFNKKILDVALPFPQNIPMHDMWLGMIAEIYFKPKFIQDQLVIYRRHENNATSLNEDFTSKEGMISKLKFRYNLLLAIANRVVGKSWRDCRTKYILQRK